MQSNLRFDVIVEGLAVFRLLRLVLLMIEDSVNLRSLFLVVLVKVGILD